MSSFTFNKDKVLDAIRIVGLIVLLVVISILIAILYSNESNPTDNNPQKTESSKEDIQSDEPGAVDLLVLQNYFNGNK